MVRAGERRDDIDRMRRSGRIGLPYPGVGDVRSMTPLDIERAIAVTHPQAADELRSRLLRFAVDMHPGDLVLTPSAVDHEFWAYLITGPYEFGETAELPGHHHTRTVSCIGWIDRDSRWLQNKLKYLDVPASVVELRDPIWWFGQLDTMDLPQERPYRAPRPAAPVKRASTPRDPSAPRVPRAPKAPPPPKPLKANAEPERALCAGQCGLQWRVAILVDGLCPDCR